MTEPTADHRRATAERNAAAIVDAAERLLTAGTPLTMRAVAAEAGVSRPTLYGHFATIGDVVEAVVRRAVDASVGAVTAAAPDSGPPAAALERLAAASWREIARFDGLARGAAEHLGTGELHRAHRPLHAPVRALVERGRAEGAFRADVDAEWLVTTYFALVHAAADHVRAHRVARARALEMLTATLRDAFAAR